MAADSVFWHTALFREMRLVKLSQTQVVTLVLHTEAAKDRLFTECPAKQPLPGVILQNTTSDI